MFGKKVKSFYRSVVLVCVSVITVACVTNNSPDLTAGNYRSVVKIEKEDKTFFLGRYVGPEVGCFPPIENRICWPNKGTGNIYELIRQLDIESFEISASLRSAFRSEQTKDLMYLTAADIALQRGYPAFTVTFDSRAAGCSSSYSSSTYGTFSGNSYYGSTSVRENPYCAGTYGITVLLFKNKEELGKGVLYNSNPGSGKTNRPVPYTFLYFGVTSGLDPSIYIGVRKYGSDMSSFYTTPRNAWKVHYDANGLSKALREKYKISDASPYDFIDESVKNSNREISPIEKNKMVSPYTNQGQHDRAIRDYTKALEINPKDAAAYNNRGNAYDDKGKHDRAIRDYTKALEINPKDAIAYYNRGLAYYNKGKYDRAIRNWTKAIEINPRYAAAYNNRGRIYLVKLGNKIKGCADWKKACELGKCGNYNFAKQIDVCL